MEENKPMLHIFFISMCQEILQFFLFLKEVKPSTICNTPHTALKYALQISTQILFPEKASEQ
jgi:hypothetical protein